MAWVFPSFSFRPIRLTSTALSSLISASPIGLLQRNPQVVRRLLHILSSPRTHRTHKQVAFSILVKGRDIFFSTSPLSNSLDQEQVLRELDSLAGRFLRSENLLEPLEAKALESFSDRWGAMCGALGDLERSFLPTSHTSPGQDSEKAGESGGRSLVKVGSPLGADVSPATPGLKFRTYSNSTGSSSGGQGIHLGITSGHTLHLPVVLGHRSSGEDTSDGSRSSTS